MDKMSFWKLLTSYDKIIIPIIQRDYAQGRVGKEHIREKFLIQIKNALDSKNSGELDFVYGTVKDGCFYPLDGQQRLTTLWLMHWFIASKAGKLNEAKDTLKKFSYETRTSSREFCKELCDFDICNVSKVSAAIQKQKWFYAAWKQDPTIQSMLRMLEGTDKKNKQGNDFIDGIEKAFQCYDYDCLECRLPQCRYIDYWNQLAGNDCPVKFSKLEINSAELPVSDELYIKMNARGKPLSDFENFKADLLFSLKNDRAAVEYGSLLDNDWTNNFWDKEQINIFDARWMAFLCRFSVCMRIETSNETNEKIAAILKEWRVYKDDTDKLFFYEYKDFRDFQNIFNDVVLARLEKIFCGWQALREANDFSLTSLWGDSFDFIPVRKEKSVSTLTMKTRVLFYGTMLFCEKCTDEANKEDSCLLDKWNAWKRIMWNLAENTNESSTLEGFVGVMQMFKKLGKGCLDIYKYLIGGNSELNFNFEQLKEEIDKARQIVKPARDCNGNCCGPNYSEIQNAEKTAFFNGAIRFLYRSENGKVEWGGFAKKFKNAQSYFEKEGLKKSEYPIRNKILISFCSDWETQLKRRYLFGKKSENWRSILLDQNLCNPVHHLLSDDQSNQSMQIDNCEWLNNVIKIIVDDDEVWDEIDSKAIDSYQLERQWNAPCLWLSRYPAATIRIYDTEADRLKTIVSQADSNNTILQEKYFRNKDYDFSLYNKKYIWHPWSGMVSFNDHKMSIDDFEKYLGES